MNTTLIMILGTVLAATFLAVYYELTRRQFDQKEFIYIKTELLRRGLSGIHLVTVDTDEHAAAIQSVVDEEGVDFLANS